MNWIDHPREGIETLADRLLPRKGQSDSFTQKRAPWLTDGLGGFVSRNASITKWFFQVEAYLSGHAVLLQSRLVLGRPRGGLWD